MAFSPIQPGRHGLALLLVAALTAGCDSLSGIVPTNDATTTAKSGSEGQDTASQPSQGAASQSGRPGGGRDEMAIPNGDGAEMAEMMMGEGELAVPGGAPDEFDTASDFAGQLATAVPDDGAPDAARGKEDYLSQPGGTGLYPAGGEGKPEDFSQPTDEYLEAFAPGLEGPGGPPDEFGESPRLPGQRGPRKGSAKPTAPPKPGGLETKLRPKGGARPAPVPSRPPIAAPQKPKAGGGGSPAPAFASQPLFKLSNPVSTSDGIGDTIGFSVDYQLLRGPDADATYFWVISFEELDKSGRGSDVRKVQQAFRPANDTRTLKVILPLKGQPKEPYRCWIAAKKGNQVKQVSRTTTFPPAFK
jgi:hypothetical protein